MICPDDAGLFLACQNKPGLGKAWYTGCNWLLVCPVRSAGEKHQSSQLATKKRVMI